MNRIVLVWPVVSGTDCAEVSFEVIRLLSRTWWCFDFWMHFSQDSKQKSWLETYLHAKPLWVKDTDSNYSEKVTVLTAKSGMETPSSFVRWFISSTCSEEAQVCEQHRAESEVLLPLLHEGICCWVCSHRDLWESHDLLLNNGGSTWVFRHLNWSNILLVLSFLLAFLSLF